LKHALVSIAEAAHFSLLVVHAFIKPSILLPASLIYPASFSHMRSNILQNAYPAFGLPEACSFPGLAEVAEEVKLRHQLWASRKQWTATEADWLDAPLAKVRSIRVVHYC
jgi:hypothetical protein